MRLPLLLSVLAVSALAQDRVALPASACEGLSGLALTPDKIGLPTGGAAVQSAQMVAANAKDNPNGDYCKVVGIVKPKNPTSPNLEFEVNLPASWNLRALQMGGGGYDGSLVNGLDRKSTR